MDTKTQSFKKFVPQLKIADMISLLGAVLTGVSVGLHFGEYLVGIFPFFLGFGVLFMGLGMYGKFQIEREHINPPLWVYIIFGSCWIGLMLVGLYLVITRFAVII